MYLVKLITVILLLNFPIIPQENVVLISENLPYPNTISVFLPEDYDKKNSYPLVLMLHGYGADLTQWNEIIDLNSLADQYGFIIVCPDGYYNSWYFDVPGKCNYETYVVEDLLPELSNKYSIDKSLTFITGLSMGGHGAVYLSFNHPELFKAAGSTSGILDITKFPDNWDIKELLGDYDKNKNLWEKHSCHFILKQMVNPQIPLIIDCGTEDFAYEVNMKFAELCRKKGCNIDYISKPGNHDYNYWKTSILEHFTFFSRIARDR